MMAVPRHLRALLRIRTAQTHQTQGQRPLATYAVPPKSSSLALRSLNSAAAVANTYSPLALERVEELDNEAAVSITWQDGFTAKFHKLWLRDHCTCPECQHPETKQRQIDTASIELDPSLQEVLIKNDSSVAITWAVDVRGTSCKASEFDAQWLRDHAYSGDLPDYPLDHRQPRLDERALWDKSLQLPTHDFAAAMRDIKPVMRDVYKYGLVMIVNTPSSMVETEKFSRKIGFVMETIYGKMWKTAMDQGYNDTASTNLELLHHTDGTYIHDSPGLQIFNCVAQAGEGGDSRYIDAFNVAEQLRKQNPRAFEFLSTTPLHYHTFDNDAHLSTMEPIIRVDHAGHIIQFRHNDYDRAPLTHLPFDKVELFYRYHRELMQIMRQECMEKIVRLNQGDMIIVDNHRVMHGRKAFNGGDRELIGCYIGHTEYESRLRVLGII